MFHPAKFSKYERPEGYSKSSPVVYVRKNVIRDLGMPTVNYDGLEELFHKDLGVPLDVKPKAKLYGGSIGKRAVRTVCAEQVSPDFLYGFHTAYTNTIHVNASSTERGGMSTMSTFVHEAQHLSDSRNFPLARAIEMGIGVGILKSGAEAANLVHIPEIIGVLAAREGWYAVQPAERRARAVQNSEVAVRHSQDIVFPPRYH